METPFLAAGNWCSGSLRPLGAKSPASADRLTFTYTEIETVNSLFNRELAQPCIILSPPLLLLSLHPPWPQRDRDRETERERKGRAPSWDRALNEHNQVFTCCSREGCQDASKHHVGRLGGIHRCMDPSLAVVGDQGRGLRVIGLQAGFQGCFVIIRTAYQGLSSDLGEARGQSPASCSLARSPLLSAATTTPAPLLQDRLQCRAVEAIPRSAGRVGQTQGSRKSPRAVTEERRIQHCGLSHTHHSAC